MSRLSSARVVVLDTDAARCVEMCRALTTMGVPRVLPAATADEARRIEASEPVDLCIVELGDFGGTLPENPLGASRIPAILVGTAERRAAWTAGYDLVVGRSVSPRFLYRRIGWLLQRRRRGARKNPDAAVLVAAAATR